MKHTFKITTILLAMFLVTQIIGVVVVSSEPLKVQTEINGTVQQVTNPYLSWMDVPEPETQQDFTFAFGQLIMAFFIAISLLIFLMKFKIEIFLRLWFFAVVTIALFLSIVSFEKIIPVMIELKTAMFIALAISLSLAYLKIFKRDIFIHNMTELLIYPGIAAIFVPILNFYTIIILLILISIYDIWAVWHSGVMQKMAKYQIDKVKVFSGFFVPYMSDKVKTKIQKIKKSKKKNKKVKVNVAVLGGGDIIFPIITAGIMYGFFSKTPILAASLVILGATSGLAYLFFFAKKRKFYPAMPFITTGILIGIFLTWIIYTKILGFTLNIWPFI